MRILFIGCVNSSYVLLSELINQGFNICGVITKKSSSINSDFCDLTKLCSWHNIDLFYTKGDCNSDMINFINKQQPKIIYCFGWSHLLSKEVIQIPKYGVVGFHPSKLPYNRGRHPLIWALVLGLDRTASSFFMIDEKVDHGDIVSQVDVMIDLKDNAATLYEKVMNVAKIQVVELTRLFEEKKVKHIKQDDNVGNCWRKRTKVDGKIDFRMSSLSIYNLVRGLSKPYVGAHIECKGVEYKIWEADIIDNHGVYRNLEPGKVISVESSKTIIVKTGDGIIRIICSDKIDIKIGEYL